VESGRALKKWRRGWNLATELRRKGYGLQGQGKDKVAPRTSKRWMFGRKHQPKLEHNKCIRNRGLRQQLQSKEEFTKIIRNSTGLEIAK
jgi:hypothetical protein